MVGRGGMRIGLGSQIYMLDRDRFCVVQPFVDVGFEVIKYPVWPQNAQQEIGVGCTISCGHSVAEPGTFNYLNPDSRNVTTALF